MLDVIRKNIAPLVALFIYVLGNGLISTYLANELTTRGIQPIMIGLMTTFLYAGLVLGSFHIEKFINRVTHIRAYAPFASAMAIIPLLHLLFKDIYFWLILRFIAGIATAGVFIVIESWLLSHSTLKTRGQVLALYMITFYASQSLGQLFLKLGENQEVVIYCLISMMTSLSVIPMSTTKNSTPCFSEPSTLNPKSMFAKCASGLFGSLFGGLILGSLYGLFPVFLKTHLESNAAVANNMAILIFGGMLLQYPIGKLSDVIERRIVLLGICLASIALIASVLMSYTHWGLFIYLIICCLVLIILLSWRRQVSEASPQEEMFITVTQNTPIISEVDPRGESFDEAENK